jgi:hypothetical protein
MMGRGLLLLAIFSGILNAADTREIAGRVVDAQTGEPVAHARVTVQFYEQARQGVGVSLLSGVDGSFRITNVPEGGYSVSYEKAGYLPGNQTMPRLGSGEAKRIPLVLRLTAQAAIEGTVVDDQGAPVPFASILLVHQQVEDGRRQLQPAQGGSADESGYFRLFGLPAGRYYVGVMAHVNGMRRAKSMAYPPLFYPNATELAAAQPFDLQAGGEQQLRIRLPEPLPAREIRGVVAAAAVNVGVTLVRQPAGRFSWPSIFETNWDAKTRTFRISGVTAGTYLLTAGAQEGNNWLQASTMVTVGNADVTGLRLEPVDSGIDGTVRVEAGAGPAQPVPAVTVRSRSSGGNGAPVDDDGRFHIPNIAPDTYRLIPSVVGSHCVRSILQAGRDVRDGLVVAAEGAREPVEILVTSHCGSLEGMVTPSDSNPPADLMAALLRKGTDELVLEKEAYVGVGVAGATQRFVMQGITPGEYTLYVWPREEKIEWANPEYMHQFESYGKAVTVTEDGKVSVTVDKVLTGAR